MKRFILAVLAVLASVGLGRAQEDKFSSALSPDEFVAAGLDLLSPEQRSRLDALIAAHLSRPRPVVIRPAETVPVAAPAPVVTPSPQVSPVPKPVVVEATTEAKPANPEIPATAKLIPVPKKSDPKTSNVIVETTIPGKFRGWDGRTVFVLANGQRLQVANNDSYFTPAVENPRVQVLSAALAGYWLRFPDLDVQVRVNLIEGK
jgi:hypothetical protein